MQLKENKNLVIGLTIVFSLILLWMYDMSRGRNENRIIKSDELIQIVGTLTNQPAIEVAEQGGPWLQIKLKEFPNFKFNIDGVYFLALKAKDFVQNVKIGDTVILDILAYDYTTKIKRDKVPRISEQIINNTFIEPYRLKAKGQIYMPLDDANVAFQDDESLGFWLLIPAIILLAIYAVLDLTGVIEKFKNWIEGLQTSH